MNTEKGFNPYDPKYKKFEDLPTDQQGNFRKNSSYKKGVGYYEDGFVKNSSYREADSQEQAARMHEIVASGRATNYGEAEEVLEEDIRKEHLISAKKAIERGVFTNLPYDLEEAGETGLVSRFYNEVLPKIGIEMIERCQVLLGECGEPTEKNIGEFESIFGHDIYKLSIGWNEKFPRTPYYLLISKFTAEISILWEDYRNMDYLKFIDDEERFKEIERLAEEDEKNRPQDNWEAQMAYDKGRSERMRSIERIEKYRNIIKKFLKDVEDMKENKINPKEVLAEIEKEIDDKL